MTLQKQTIKLWAIFYFVLMCNVTLLLLLPGIWTELGRELKAMPNIMVVFVFIVGLGVPIVGIALFQIADILENKKPIVALPISLISLLVLLTVQVL